MADRKLEMAEERSFDSPLLTFELPSLLDRIKNEERWQRERRYAMTLVNTRGLRVVLIALRTGATLSSHRADGPITVQTIDGHIRFSADSRTVDLRTGRMLTLESGIQHAVEAVEDSVFLLTVAPETRPLAESVQ